MRIVMLGQPRLAAALQALGHDVLTAGSMGDFDLPLSNSLSAKRFGAMLASRGFVPDILVQMDDGNLPLVLGLETSPFPQVFYSIDTFCNPWHIPFAYAFDHVLAAQKDFAAMFEAEGHATTWFPLFCQTVSPAQTRDEWLAGRDIPVAFVGTLQPKNIPDRLPFLQAFQAHQPLVMAEGAFAPVFSRTRIVLNQTAASEVNYRCFEAMGCGAALLTDNSQHGFKHIFREGVDVLPTYTRLAARSAAMAAKYWLARPEALAELALAGARLVAARHTDKVRAVEMAALCENLLASRAQTSRLVDLPRRRYMLSTAYATLASELPDSLTVHRDFYTALAVEACQIPA